RCAIETAVGHGKHFGERRKSLRHRLRPAGNPHAPYFHLFGHCFGRSTRDDEYGHRGRMIGTIDERQARDDLGRGREFQGAPPAAASSPPPAPGGTRTPFPASAWQQ